MTPSTPHDARAHLKAMIVRMLTDNQTPSLALAARKLGVTPRTLQRRLRDEATSFRRVVDEARLELAARALPDARTIATAATSLGFSGASPFHRAFRRWTGLTPRSFEVPAGAAPSASAGPDPTTASSAAGLGRSSNGTSSPGPSPVRGSEPRIMRR